MLSFFANVFLTVKPGRLGFLILAFVFLGLVNLLLFKQSANLESLTNLELPAVWQQKVDEFLSQAAKTQEQNAKFESYLTAFDYLARYSAGTGDQKADQATADLANFLRENFPKQATKFEGLFSGNFKR